MMKPLAAIAACVSLALGSGSGSWPDSAYSPAAYGGPLLDRSYVTTIGPINFGTLFGVAVGRDGNIYISPGSQVLKLTPAGSITVFAGNGSPGYCGDGGPAAEACLYWPTRLTVDAAGDLYICDRGNGRVRKVTMATGIITTIAGPGIVPADVAIDPKGDLLVADDWSRSILRISTAGIVSTVATYGWAAAVEVDAAGNIFFAANNSLVLKVSVDTGIVTTIAGNSGCAYGSDGGPADHAGICVTDIAFDREGDLYIAESQPMTFGRIRKVTMATGIISTVAGTGRSWGEGPDGVPGTWATFYRPQALAFDHNGNLLVADNRLRQVVFPQDDVPLAGDMDGDGRADLVLWRPATGTWHWLTSTSGYSPDEAQSKQWGASATADVPLLADIDGDARADLIIYRPATATWHWLTSTTGYSVPAAGEKPFGNRIDIPMAADLDGDAKADLIVWRPSDGTWYWLSSSSGYSDGAVQSKQWGNGGMGDSPLAADIDGDGRMDLTVWRRATGWWWAPGGIWFWLSSGQGYDYATGACRWWGSWLQHDVPMAAEIDGDGKADLIVWRPTNGTWYWTSSSHNYTDTMTRQWGSAVAEIGDQPLIGDFDGDGKTELAIWRASTGTWFLLMSADQYSYVTGRAIQWGSTR